MAQTGYTPIFIYSSSTASNTPSASNLTNGTLGSELAINIADGKLFYKDTGNNVQVIGWKTTPTTAGGTGLTSFTAGDLPYYATGTALSKLGIGTSGYFLTSSGTAPQWTNPTSVAVTSLSFGTTGLTPSTATQGAITVAGTLATTNGGTGLTSFTANGVVYASSTSALTTSSNLSFSSNQLTITNNGSTNYGVQVTGSYNGYLGASIYNSNSSSSAVAFLQLGNNTSQYLAWIGVTNSSWASFGGGNALVLNQGSSNPIVFATNGSERARVHGSGGVSIGNTTDPGATNLSVSGNFVASTSGKGVDFTAAGSGSGTKYILTRYEEGSYTSTGTGFTSAPSSTTYYTINGDIVFLQTSSLSNPSNATTFTITGMPTQIRPSAARNAIVWVQDNGTYYVGSASIATSGTITLYRDVNLTAFTASGNKGLVAQLITYSL